MLSRVHGGFEVTPEEVEMSRHLNNLLYAETRNASASVARVRELIAAGADVNRVARSSGGRTPLMIAAANGRTDIVEVLLHSRANTDTVDHNGVTAVFLAATNGHEQTVEVLLSHGANPNAGSQDQDSWSPLTGAVFGGFTSIVTLLLDAGAAVDFRWRGKTMLEFAEGCGRPEIVALLRRSRRTKRRRPRD